MYCKKSVILFYEFLNLIFVGYKMILHLNLLKSSFGFKYRPARKFLCHIYSIFALISPLEYVVKF